ncbi:MAG: SDR family oxidoreductase [Clostridia bacterium]
MNIIITGASGGIGLATAICLKNHNLALQYNKNPISLENQHSYKCNLTKPEEVENMFDKILIDIGEIDVLINNAGISEFSVLQDISLENWTNMLNVNLTSAFLCTKKVIPSMLRSGGGHIINVSSIWGQCGASCEAHYSASKGGLIAFTKAMAQELAPSNILVNCICPGLIETDMNKNLSKDDIDAFVSEIPLGRAGKPDEIAKAIEFLINQSYITGQVLAINGGLYM